MTEFTRQQINMFFLSKEFNDGNVLHYMKNLMELTDVFWILTDLHKASTRNMAAEHASRA